MTKKLTFSKLIDYENVVAFLECGGEQNIELQLKWISKPLPDNFLMEFYRVDKNGSRVDDRIFIIELVKPKSN